MSEFIAYLYSDAPRMCRQTDPRRFSRRRNLDHSHRQLCISRRLMGGSVNDERPAMDAALC